MVLPKMKLFATPETVTCADHKNTKRQLHFP